MNTTALFIEFIIIGFIFSLCSILGFDWLSPINFLDYLTKINNFKEIAIIISLALFYVLGIITYRIIDLINLEKVDFLTNWCYKKSKSTRAKEWKNWEARYIVFQFGSEKIIDRVGYHQTFLRILKATTILFPLLLCLSQRYLKGNSGAYINIFTMLISYLSLISYRTQERNYATLIENAEKVISKNLTLKTDK